jgi:hypothetical protein
MEPALPRQKLFRREDHRRPARTARTYLDFKQVSTRQIGIALHHLGAGQHRSPWACLWIDLWLWLLGFRYSARPVERFVRRCFILAVLPLDLLIKPLDLVSGWVIYWFHFLKPLAMIHSFLHFYVLVPAPRGHSRRDHLQI